MGTQDVRASRDGRPSPTDVNATQNPHEVSLIQRGPFLQPVCGCGWAGVARRSRPLAGREADEHAGTRVSVPASRAG